MATKLSRSLKNEAESTLALAGDLQKQLTTIDGSEDLALSSETLEQLKKYLDRLPLFADGGSSSTRRQLDNEGTKLWNICVQRTRLIKGKEGIVLLCKVKALAYAMLNTASPRTSPGNYRSLQLAFRIIKSCIDNRLVDLSQKMMESAATRLDMLEKSKSDTVQLKFETFATEYYMLRIYLAWSQDRPDIADHLFSKLPKIKNREQWIVVVDICYTIGSAALSSSQYNIAATWLGRALTVCEMDYNERQNGADQGLKDKRLLILHAFARANLHLTTAGSEGQLQRALGLLRNEYGELFHVLVFFLEVLSRKQTADGEYFETLMSTIKAMDDAEGSVKIIHHYIKRLGSSSPELFVEVFGQLMNKLRISNISNKEQWIERIFVSFIYELTSTVSSVDQSPDLAEATAHQLTEYGLSKLSEGATNASLILIWKYVDTMLSKGSISIAEQWCRFVSKQQAFQKTADTEAKFFRKLILCALEKNDPSVTRRIFDEVPEGCKTCPLTLYLLYRLAALAEDVNIAVSSLQSLCIVDAEATYVWSCIASTLKLGKTNIAVQSVQTLTSLSDNTCLERLQISQLLRCVICVVCEKADATFNNEHLLGHVVSLFETALDAAARGQSKLFSSADLCWFACRSYSIAVDLHKTSSSRTVIRLLEISVKFMELYQEGPEAESDVRLLEHYLRCYFLWVAITTTTARRKEDSTAKENRYKEAREIVKQFQARIHSLEDGSFHQWIDKYRIILSFDFEATVSLRQWEDLTKIIETSKSIVDAKLSSVFLDCLLRSGAPSSYLSQFVKQIIRTYHTSPSPFLNTETFNFTEHLPRYLRCLFSLSTQAEEYVLAESVLNQALILARDNPSTRSRYPSDELQWLAIMAFNRAVEFFLMSADVECCRWAEKAIALADLIEDDGGKLARLLRGNLARLKV